MNNNYAAFFWLKLYRYCSFVVLIHEVYFCRNAARLKNVCKSLKQCDKRSFVRVILYNIELHAHMFSSSFTLR